MYAYVLFESNKIIGVYSLMDNALRHVPKGKEKDYRIQFYKIDEPPAAVFNVEVICD